MLIIDAHLDLAYNAVVRGRDVTRPAGEQPVVENEIATVGLPDLRRGGVSLICATIFCTPRSEREPWGYSTADEAHQQALAQWDWYQRQIAAGELALVRTAADLDAVFNRKSQVADPKFPIPLVLLLEGADAFRTPDDVAWWHAQGLRVVGLAWHRTRMAGGTGEPGPLTDEGRAIVRGLDALGMIHDTSHLAERSFWDLLEMTSGPMIASHSNCRAIVPTDRQLSDAMIDALVARGGVIGINFSTGICSRPSPPSMSDPRPM